MMIPGLMVLTLRSALAPPHRLGQHPQRVAALGDLVGVERIGDPVRLQHRQCEQVVGRCRRQHPVLLGGQRRQPVSGHRCDDHARSAGRDDIAEFLQHQRRAVEID